MQSRGHPSQSLPTPGTEREMANLPLVNANNNNANRTATMPSTQTSYCQRRNKTTGKHRHAPYDRSPGGGSTCSTSSDESSNEDGEAPVKVEQHLRKRTAANERERKRMHTVNSAFDQLRELVPTYPSTRKLSKIDTLKMACAYIQDLKALLISSQIMPHGEDVVYQPDGYATTNSSPAYPGVLVKAEYGSSDYSAASACNYQPYRVQPSYISVSIATPMLVCVCVCVHDDVLLHACILATCFFHPLNLVGS